MPYLSDSKGGQGSTDGYRQCVPPTAADSHEDLWAKGRYLIRSNQICESSEPTCGTPTKCAQIDASPQLTRAATAAVFRSNGFGPQRGTEAQCVPSRRLGLAYAHSHSHTLA